MPTYEYACQSCGHHLEVFQRFADDPLTTCSECGGPLRKVFHPAGILFKGSGFYATDSRRSTAGKGGDKASEAKPSDSKTADSKEDSKGDSKGTTGAGDSGSTKKKSESGGKGAAEKSA